MNSGDDFHRPDVLLPSEMESYIDALEVSTFEELGSNRWIEKHDRIEKLTLQAIVQALSDREETVKDVLVSRDKLSHLVHDLILTELWREVIFPELLKEDPKCSFGIYTVLYHEATCVNLIETILFHPEAAETMGDAALDLVDYCFRSLNWLLTRPPGDYQEEMDPMDMNLLKQSNSVLFRISFKALTCLRYIIENIDKIHTSIVPRLVVSADAPMLLTDILLQRPWICSDEKTGKEMIYNSDEQRWTTNEDGNKFMIGKIEGQAWLALYQLFKHSRVISSYEIHNYRKNQLMKLRPKLHEVTLDQIPVLAEFSRWLNEVAITNGPIGPSKSPLILEMIPPFRSTLETELKNRKDEILELQIAELVNASQDLMTEKARKLAETYDFEAFEAILPKSAKCAACGEVASKRCGKCRNEWYCKRECQVKHWPKHKPVCELSCDSPGSGNWK